MHEAQLHEHNVFITLTYDDEHLPHHGNLVKSHYQDFMKRLRWHYKTPIKYFHCGEYGEKFSRPHYHACLFGVQFPDRELHADNRGIRLDTSRTLDNLWRKGFTTVGELTFESAAYVARYCTKKVTGPAKEEHYQRVTEYGELVDVEPEYVTMSRGGRTGKGLANAWFKDFATDVYPWDEVISNGHPSKPPRYYDKLYEHAHPDEFQRIRDARRAGINPEENTPARLAVREECAIARTQQLTRNYENANARSVQRVRQQG